MNETWNPQSYDASPRRLVPCYADFYGTVGDLIRRSVRQCPSILDLGAGTGLLSGDVVERVNAGALTLQDVSGRMLAVAERRLQRFNPRLVVLDFATDFAPGTDEVIRSALAKHFDRARALGRDEDAIPAARPRMESINAPRRRCRSSGCVVPVLPTLRSTITGSASRSWRVGKWPTLIVE